MKEKLKELLKKYEHWYGISRNDTADIIYVQVVKDLKEVLKSEKQSAGVDTEKRQALYDCVEAWVSAKLHELRYETRETVSKAIADYVWVVTNGYREKYYQLKEEQKQRAGVWVKASERLPNHEDKTTKEYWTDIGARYYCRVNNRWENDEGEPIPVQPKSWLDENPTPQKQSAGVCYEVVSKDDWFAMRTDEREQLVAGRDLKTGNPIWLRKTD